jgi:hypothetical protein
MTTLLPYLWIVPVLIGIPLVGRAIYRWGYHGGTTTCKRDVERLISKRLAEERSRALIEGEKVGFEKGYEAGRGESRREQKQRFVAFLEEQLNRLKNERVAPATEEVFRIQ